MSNPWCTIESDPGVFTELIQKFGVNGVQVEELYTLDQAEFARHLPIYGLIFLFKYRSETDDRPTIDQQVEEPELFFAHQVKENACATQAILSVLLNSKDVALGPHLSEFKQFTREFNPNLRGISITNSDPIREAHNSFARAEPFVMEESKTATEKDDVFHFIAYVPFGNRVYELDGLKPGPILLGEGEDWLSVAGPAIQARIERYSSSEIRFNLMAIVRNKKDLLTEKLTQREAELAAVEGAISGNEAMDTTAVSHFQLATGAEALQEQRTSIQQEMQQIQSDIGDEEAKFAKWRLENIRRKHNYIPFVVNLLRMLAERGHLQPMVEKAQQNRREAQQQRSAQAQAAKA